MAGQNRNARGKSFTSQQDEAICTAYLCITQDPIVGNSQALGKFWDRTNQKYGELTNDDQRTDASIKSRWQTIQKACNKYRGYLVKIQRNHQSGMTDRDEVDLAKKHYRESEDKPFPHLDGCFAILEHSMKWSDIPPAGSSAGMKANSSQMDTSSIPPSPDSCYFPDLSQIPNTCASVDGDSGGSIQSPRKRPIGTKSAKEKKAKNKKYEAEDREFFNLMEKINQQSSEKEARKAAAMEKHMAFEEKKLAIEERKEARREKEREDSIMQMKLELIDDPQLKIYYQRQKEEILAKWGSSSSYFPDY